MKGLFKIFFTIAICLFLTIVFTTCKKYPEGGCERRAPKNILGAWKLSLYEVNGIDSTDLINYNGDDGYKKVSILKNVSTVSINCSGFSGSSASFKNNNKEIVFNTYGDRLGIYCAPSAINSSINYCYRSYFVPEGSSSLPSMEWTIEKLTKKEIVIKSEGKNSYLIKLSK